MRRYVHNFPTISPQFPQNLLASIAWELAGLLMSGLSPPSPISVNVIFIQHGNFPVIYDCISICRLGLVVTLTICLRGETLSMWILQVRKTKVIHPVYWLCPHDSHVLPPLHGDECQAAQGQCGDGLQQVGHQPGWGPYQGGVC